jgi:hypothetical protein
MRWCDASHTSHRWAYLGTKYRNCMGLTGRPLVHHKFNCSILVRRSSEDKQCQREPLLPLWRRGTLGKGVPTPLSRAARAATHGGGGARGGKSRRGVSSPILLCQHVAGRWAAVTAFKTRKYLENLRQTNQRVKINCNSGALRTNLIGNFGTMKAWYIPDGIANIFLMNKLEKKYCITYNSWEGYYVVHTASGEVRFYKDGTAFPTLTLKSHQKMQQPCWCRLARRKQQQRLCRRYVKTRGIHQAQNTPSKEGTARNGNDREPQQRGLQEHGKGKYDQ